MIEKEATTFQDHSLVYLHVGFVYLSILAVTGKLTAGCVVPCVISNYYFPPAS